MGCDWLDVNCHLRTAIPALAPVIKALDAPYRAAVNVATAATKGTPIGGLVSGLQLASVGKTQEALKQYVKGALDVVSSAVPGLNNLPGIGILKDAAVNLVPSPSPSIRAAGGAALAAAVPKPPVNNSAIASFAVATPNATKYGAPMGVITTLRAPPAPAAGVAKVVAQASTTVAPPPPVAKGPKKLPTFTREQWTQAANARETVGGTQVWGR